ncbi:MAG TPA: hypothetical protein VHO48_14890, partial [Anaerolineaceae bacterium]|nr:hypothetical protein [Anaerolineaceae bacterium]
FGTHLVDPMSGYRVFTREVADNLPIVANGFDVETEMTLQLLYRKFVIKEIPIPYRSRPEGSVSKLRTFQDGFRVLVKILGIVRAYKPLTFFGGLGILSALLGLIIGSFVIFEYIQYQYIYSVPKAILSASLMVLGTLLAAIGLILNAMNFRLLEMMSVLTKQLEKSRIASLEKYRID